MTLLLVFTCTNPKAFTTKYRNIRPEFLVVFKRNVSRDRSTDVPDRCPFQLQQQCYLAGPNTHEYSPYPKGAVFFCAEASTKNIIAVSCQACQAANQRPAVAAVTPRPSSGHRETATRYEYYV